MVVTVAFSLEVRLFTMFTQTVFLTINFSVCFYLLSCWKLKNLVLQLNGTAALIPSLIFISVQPSIIKTRTRDQLSQAMISTIIASSLQLPQVWSARDANIANQICTVS